MSKRTGISSGSYHPKIAAMHRGMELRDQLAEQAWLAANPDFVARQEHNKLVSGKLIELMGETHFSAWFREQRFDADNFTTEYGILLDKKLEEIKRELNG